MSFPKPSTPIGNLVWTFGGHEAARRLGVTVETVRRWYDGNAPASMTRAIEQAYEQALEDMRAPTPTAAEVAWRAVSVPTYAPTFERWEVTR